MNWNSKINEMIIVLFILRKSDGQLFLAEEWNIKIENNQNKSLPNITNL